MRPRTLRSLTPLLLLATAAAGPTTLPTTPVRELAAEFEAKLAKARYMESGQPQPATVPGWEGLPTQRYTYSVKDHDGTIKSADVILLDPSATQIARWIVQAVTEVTGTYDPAPARKAFQNVLSQSGGQFPVAGVVYEDILPHDGTHEAYCFRDGVTVEVEGLPHRQTTPLTHDQVEASLTGKIKRVFTYARVQSTSPKMWIAAGGSPDILAPDGKPTDRWREVIRDEYKKAWNSDRNALMVAWLKAAENPIKPQVK